MDKASMGNQGIHFPRYNSNVTINRSKSPQKNATSFYYQSDGSGRDTYVLADNGGLRPDYNKHSPGVEKIFKSSLRNEVKSPIKSFKSGLRDRADITTYLNWQSEKGKVQN